MNIYEEFLEHVKAGDQEIVARMLERDPALVNLKDDDGTSAVLLAMYYGHPELADYLVKNGARLNLFEAAAAGSVATVEDILKENPESINDYSHDGFQPLGLAAFFGRQKVVGALLSQGAEVNSPSKNRMQVTPLNSAAASQQLEIARLLIEHGADVNAPQADGFTPLHAAAQNGQLEMAELLVSHGANAQAKSDQGKTPLDLAQEQGHEKVVNYLAGK